MPNYRQPRKQAGPASLGNVKNAQINDA